MLQELNERAEACIELAEAMAELYTELGDEVRAEFWRAEVLTYMNEIN